MERSSSFYLCSKMFWVEWAASLYKAITIQQDYIVSAAVVWCPLKMVKLTAVHYNVVNNWNPFPLIHLGKGRDKKNWCWKLPEVMMKWDVFWQSHTQSRLKPSQGQLASLCRFGRLYCCGHFWTVLPDGRQECQTLDCIDSAIVLMAMQKLYLKLLQKGFRDVLGCTLCCTDL